MRVLVVSQYYYPEPFRINEICEELLRRGDKVTVVTSVPNYPDGDVYNGFENKDYDQIINGVLVLRCKCRPRKKGAKNLLLNYISYYLNVKRRLKSLPCDFDVVYTYQLSPISSSLPALDYARKYKIPSVLYCLDLWPESIICYAPHKSLTYKLVSKLSSSIYKKASKIAVTSPSFIDYISHLTKIEQCQIVWIPQHCYDLGLIEKAADDGCVNFMFLGNIGESQYIDGLMKAISYVDKSLNFRVHIVGSGSALEEVMILCDSMHLQEKVVFHGRQSKERMPEYYKMADVGIVSLRHEGVVGWTIPGKVQEYMSAGKAILGCIDGDTKVVINEAKCGLCCEAEDIKAYAANIVRMINNKDVLKEYGQNARNYYLEHFTLKKHIDALTKEFNNLIGG